MIQTYLPGYTTGKPGKRRTSKPRELTWNDYYAKSILKDINDSVRVLKGAGYSNAVIAGILGNVWEESKFKEDSTNPKNGRRGYFLHLPKDYGWLVKNYGHGAGNQMRYIIDWDKNPKKVGLSTYGYKPKGKWNPNAKTPEDAADSFLNAFERAPGQGVSGRRNAAKAYFNWLNSLDKNGTPATPAVPDLRYAPKNYVNPNDATRVSLGLPTSMVDPNVINLSLPELQADQNPINYDLLFLTLTQPGNSYNSSLQLPNIADAFAQAFGGSEYLPTPFLYTI